MRIKFIKNATYEQNDKSQCREYVAGEEYDVADDHGKRWLRRQIAFEVPAKAKSVKADTAKLSEAPAEIVTKGK
jgi:hypothetical protein